MGQARQRGTLAQRQQAAIDQQLALRPKFITCNHCQATLTEMAAVDVSKMPGITAAFEASCAACGHDTYAIKGEPEAVARLHALIEQAAGGSSGAGVVPAANKG
ncbi:hypothetical protein ACWA7J_09275 [Leptothrix sp. BB-4]